MIIAAGILGLIVGLLGKGRWRSIFAKRFRLLPLLFISLSCSIFLASKLGSTFLAGYVAENLMRSLIAAAQLLTISLFLFVNRRKPGVPLIFVGGLMNGMVIMLNGGRMPVGQYVVRYGEQALARIEAAPHYFLAQGGEPLLFLADLIPFFGLYMASIGDFLIAAGIFWLGIYMSKPVLRRRSPAGRHIRQT